MKTKEELELLKKEYRNLIIKLSKLTEEELEEISGGEVLFDMLYVIVPNVIGQSYDDAKNKLSSLGLAVDSKYEHSSKLEGTVIMSDPLPGMQIKQGSKVILTLSSGK